MPNNRMNSIAGDNLLSFSLTISDPFRNGDEILFYYITGSRIAENRGLKFRKKGLLADNPLGDKNRKEAAKYTGGDIGEGESGFALLKQADGLGGEG